MPVIKVKEKIKFVTLKLLIIYFLIIILEEVKNRVTSYHLTNEIFSSLSFVLSANH